MFPREQGEIPDGFQRVESQKQLSISLETHQMTINMSSKDNTNP